MLQPSFFDVHIRRLTIVTPGACVNLKNIKLKKVNCLIM